MPIVHTNPHNRELKLLLKRNGITYDMLSAASGYTRGTITQWMRFQLSETHKEVIEQSIQKVMKNHDVPTIPDLCVNADLRQQMLDDGISYSDLSRHTGCSNQTMRDKILDSKLSPAWRERVEKAIQQIREERRLLYEN